MSAPRLPCIWASVLLLAPVTGRAAVVEVGPGDDLRAAMNALRPGDELVLRGGTYPQTARLGVTVVGTETQPIVIRAKDGERPHLTRAAQDQNIIDIDDAAWATFRGIEFSGGSAGVRISRARFLTIEDCEIHDTGDVALRANDGGTYESLRIRRNHIHHTNGTGEGMYLGCNSDACRVANSVVEANWVHHTNNPSTVVQGDGIELKEGSYGNVIRDNVVHDTNYPCILTYSAVGNGPPNVIEGNALWGCGDHGIQSAADAVIRNNVILSSGGDGIAMQPHQAGSPANLVVVHNTVLKAAGDAVSLRGATGSVVIANNALYAQAGRAIYASGGTLAQVTSAGNVGLGGVVGLPGGLATGSPAADMVAAHFGGAPPIDVFPKAGGGLVGSGSPAYAADDDFNGTPRHGVADVGAYAYAPGGNPGWALGEGFKDLPAAGPGGGPDVGGGCACRSAPGGALGPLAALAALAALRRRRVRNREAAASSAAIRWPRRPGRG